MAEPDLLSACSTIIRYYDMIYRNYFPGEEEFQEKQLVLDLVKVIGMDTEPHFHKGPDIIIPSLDYQIQVKYIRNSESWDGDIHSVYMDFLWLDQEAPRNKSAFIIGWFTDEIFTQKIQLGAMTGANPLLHRQKFAFFPFLGRETRRIDSVFYRYDEERHYIFRQKGGPYSCFEMECYFVGNPSDRFHFAVYHSLNV